jgi:predicted RNase H-like HicB family nuclease
MRTFTAVLYREEDMYVAECPEVGTVSQGRTVEEAVANLKEATELYLEEAPPLRREARAPVTGCTDFPLEDGRRPIITTFEVAEGARA